MNVRAVAIDLDGTLLLPSEEVSERNRRALQAASTAGLHVIIASARWFQLAERAAAHAPAARLVIACSGAQVRDLPTRSDIFDLRLPVDFARALYSLCDANRCIATFAFDEDVAVRLENAPAGDPRFPEMRFVPQLGALTESPPRIALIQGSEITRLIREALEQEWASQVMFVESMSSRGKPILTLTARGADKGVALTHACEALGIAPGDVVAIGDSDNDLEMFRVAGAGVAMGNATPAVRAAAAAVTASNLDDGVALAIEHLVATGSLDGLRT